MSSNAGGNNTWTQTRQERRGNFKSVEQAIAHDLDRLSNPGIYRVKAGDTLWDLAEALHLKYDTDLATPRLINAIAQQNSIANPNLIRVGQKLDISKWAEPADNNKDQEKPAEKPTENPVEGSKNCCPKPEGASEMELFGQMLTQFGEFVNRFAEFTQAYFANNNPAQAQPAAAVQAQQQPQIINNNNTFVVNQTFNIGAGGSAPMAVQPQPMQQAQPFGFQPQPMQQAQPLGFQPQPMQQAQPLGFQPQPMQQAQPVQQAHFAPMGVGF